MNNIKIDSLLVRAQKHQELPPLKAEDIHYVSKELQIVFANDFVKITIVCDYECLGTFEFHTFCYDHDSGVVSSTNKCRRNGLPSQYVVLADQGDAGSILTETQDAPDKPSPVIWCDYEDLWNLCETGKFEYNPTIWPSFTDFFEYLVEQEEGMLKEQEK